MKTLKTFTPHKLNIENPSIKSADWKSVDLLERLKISLTKERLDKAYSLLKRRNMKYVASYGALLIGITGLISTAAAIANYLVLSPSNENSIIQSVGLLVAFAGISILSIWSYFLIREKLKTERFNPLPSNGFHPFTEDEMEKRWQFFLNWLKSSNAEIGVQQKDGTSVLFTPALLDYELLEIFILGETRHRDILMSDASINTSPLVIKNSYWEEFERLWEIQVGLSTGNTQTAIVEEEEAPVKHSRKVDKALSLIQRARGPNTNRCPRLEIIIRNSDILSRARQQKLDLTTQYIGHKPCYNALLVIEEHFDDIHLFFSSVREKKAYGANLHTIRDEISNKLGKAVNSHDKPSRLTNLQGMRWSTMERYLESLNIISNQEVIESFPELAKFE